MGTLSDIGFSLYRSIICEIAKTTFSVYREMYPGQSEKRKQEMNELRGTVQ